MSEGFGGTMIALIERLYPICRSISGDGVRKTLSVLSETLPLTTHEIPSGTEVFDWRIPKEWNIRDAFIETPSGARIAEFTEHNLHVMNYSTPVDQVMSLNDLEPHLHSLPDHPDWIPYRTSYYHEDWGFCLAHTQREALEPGKYRAVIDSSLEDGSLTYGELVIPGTEDREVLFFTHICHPSLCNDNLSGIVVQAHLAEVLANKENRYTYRFVFGPGTIGSIAWLARNEHLYPRIKGGLVLALLGDPAPITYKRSRRRDSRMDQAVMHALSELGVDHRILDFSPYGYDERQFCSPGINLAVGRITRSPEAGYPEYHTSADNLSLMSEKRLEESLNVSLRIVNIFENDRIFINTKPKCEPQLGRRGLYSRKGGGRNIGEYQHSLLWMLNMSDGNHSTLDIARLSGLPFDLLVTAAKDLKEAGLLAQTEKAETY